MNNGRGKREVSIGEYGQTAPTYVSTFGTSSRG
jgi:hypothetical protein